MITLDDFKKLEIKIGTIKEAVKIEDTDRLLVLKIDMGGEIRQIVSGIARYYPEPEKLVGKQVPVIVNLEPRTIKGHESQGMVLYAIEGEEKLVTLEPELPLLPGSAVR